MTDKMTTRDTKLLIVMGLLIFSLGMQTQISLRQYQETSERRPGTSKISKQQIRQQDRQARKQERQWNKQHQQQWNKQQQQKKNKGRKHAQPIHFNATAGTTTTGSTSTTPWVQVQRSDYIMDRREWDTSPILVPRFKMAFFAVPKVACTVWKQLFRRIAGYPHWDSIGNGLPHDPRTNKLRYLHQVSLDRATYIMNSPEWVKVIMVRDPMERFLSAYLDKALRSNGEYMIYCCTKAKSNPQYKQWLEQQPTTSKNKKFMGNCLNATMSSIEGFHQLTHMACPNDGHWLPQSKRLDSKYYNMFQNVEQQLVHGTTNDYETTFRKVNRLYVADMEQKESFAKWLLQHLSDDAWELYGKTGWGEFKNESIFFSPLKAIGSANSKLQQYYTSSKVIQDIEQRYQQDYQMTIFNFTKQTFSVH